MKRLLLGAAVVAHCHAAVGQQPLEKQVPCLIEPNVRLSIRSPVASTIATVPVDRGSVVRKGQTLVTLDATEEQATLAAARYRAIMEGQLRAAESRLSYLQEKLDRRQSLLKQNYVSAQDRDDVASESRTAAAEVVEARDTRELARLEVQRLAAVVHKRVITSPIDGVVTERLQHPGEMAQAGDAAGAILKLAQINPLKVEIVMPVAKYGRFKPGDVIVVRPEPPFKGSYKATVRVVDRVVDPASGTFGVRLELPNPDGSVPSGVRCTAEL